MHDGSERCSLIFYIVMKQASVSLDGKQTPPFGGP